MKRIIVELGAQMIPGDQPALPFEACGYRQISSQEVLVSPSDTAQSAGSCQLCA